MRVTVCYSVCYICNMCVLCVCYSVCYVCNTFVLSVCYVCMSGKEICSEPKRRIDQIINRLICSKSVVQMYIGCYVIKVKSHRQ